MSRELSLKMCAVAAVVVQASVVGHTRSQSFGAKKVTMQSLAVTDTLYLLMGGGVSTLALMRDEGTVLIAPKSLGWGRPIAEAINAVTEQPVTTIINTSPEQSAGNVEFAAATQIIAHERARLRIEKMEIFKGSNSRYLPNSTIKERLSLFDGGDRIELYHFGAGHTDGDLVVVFPQKRTAFFGELFPAKAAPRIDVSNGGSGVAFVQTLARAASEIRGVNRVITGDDLGIVPPRGPAGSELGSVNARTLTWSDFQEYADFMRDFVTAVQNAKRAGKSADEAAATLTVPSRYKDYDMQRARADVLAVYQELGR
jgi:glyoxylase-like metal-dependent hydrolase (beta-lactamase superfamily II)